MTDDIMSIVIPEGAENKQLPSPELLNYYKNLDERKIWIDYEIDEGLLEVTRNVLRWNKEDNDKDIPIDKRVPIRLYIFSYGGAADATINLANVCELSLTPVYTYNMGVAMSGGLLILLAGKKRYCLEGSRAMVHSGSGGVSGTGEQVEAAADDYKRLIKYMGEYVVRRSGMNQKLFNKNKTKDWFMNASEQIDYGIVHEIIKDISDII
jgi:ATP-dependent Clp protease protease subunit